MQKTTSKIKPVAPIPIERLAWSAMPKTGSCTVEAVFRDEGLPQVTRHIDKHSLTEWPTIKQSDLVVFTALRHPGNWLRSLYFYANRVPDEVQPLLGPVCVFQPHLGFEWMAFLDRIVCRPGLIDTIYEAYAGIADHTLRTERLLHDLTALLEMTDIQRNTERIHRHPWINVSGEHLPPISRWYLNALRCANPLAWQLWEAAGV